MGKHLVIIESDFVGYEGTEENVRVLFLFVFEQKVNLLGQELRVLFLLQDI